ncbi:MAG: hypothetical protein WAO74_07190 [Polaribacter sp.]|uniref:hypothetical protein n=1 Tax=Polaribacter sp. TaxID=1920175 RepID=UPI003BB0E974
MKKSTENKDKNNFLKEGLQDDISKHHKKYLGTEVPRGYFIKSKMEILDKIKQETKIELKPKKQIVFYLRPQFKYIAAASLIFMLSLSVWLHNSNNSNGINKANFEEFAFSDDVLINSIFIADSEVDAFADATLFNEVVVKAELSEQKMDNLILNSLILEDSLLDDYMDKELIENIIL